MPDIHDELHVFLNAERIGVLAQDNGAMSFAYAPEYLRSPDAYPLSQNLPLTDEVFHDPEVENFFANLLPDERIRATVAMILHVSVDNTFGMLKRIGADCAGAVSFYPAGQTPQSVNSPAYRDLSDDEAYRILDNLGQRPLDVGDDGVRISGAGSQEKLVACIRGGKVSLPLYGTPSTHIIKPEIPSFHDSVFNEFFCMKLAQKCGIPAAECDILTLNDESFYAVTRFDREATNGVTVRLHQEDFCQLLNVPPKLKYQEDGGPGVEDCVRRMAEIRLPASGRIEFLRLLVFNFLIGNCDAHAKNYAVLYRDGHPSFAPAYDLLSTMVYPDAVKRFAMNIGGETRMGTLTKEHFAELARRCDLNSKMVLMELFDMAEALPQAARKLTEELNAVHPNGIYESIAWEIGKLCRQILG